MMRVQMCLNLVTFVVMFFLSIEDWRTMEIPDRFQIMLAGCSVASLFVFPETGVTDRVIGLLCVSVPMFLLCLVVEGAFGGGDIKLCAIMGFYLGWRACLVGTMIGFFIGGIQAVILLINGKVKYGEGAHMAFGPALCAGFFTAEFYGGPIFEWYIDFFT